jgi:hypothetical protein
VDQAETSAYVERRLASTAARLGKRLLVVRTNIRALLDPSITWEIAHGPALTAVALLLSPRFERILIGAGMTYGQLFNRGSHPLHDHLWSTERCRIEHHGAHLTRAAKTSQAAQSQEALDVLRVCWRHVDRYNCGRCEKCVRTMVALEVLGALERCPTFEAPLDLDSIATLRFSDPDLPIWWRENLDLAREHNADPRLVTAVEACLAANEAGEVNDSADLAAATAQEESLANELQAVVSSHSWRLTAPLRRAGAAARRLKRRAAGA